MNTAQTGLRSEDMPADDPSGPIPLRLLPDSSEIADNGHLLIGGCDLMELADRFGTPLFVYDEEHLRARCREAVAAFGAGAAYASKAFLCRAMARLVLEEGMSIDASSLNELETILRSVGGEASVDPSPRVVMHGNNKSVEELQAARKFNVGCVVVDSFDEMDRLDALHSEDGRAQRVLLRVTPGVRPAVHKFVATGQVGSKFGFSIACGDAADAVTRAAASASTEIIGLHFHIGSQLLELDSMTEALDAVAEFAAPLFGNGGIAEGCLREISVGGGLGVPYTESEHAPTITAWGEKMRTHWDALRAQHGLEAQLTAEPGRAITAQAAVTVYTAGTIKPVADGPAYVAVDGGFCDNLRPMLYGSQYTAFMPDRADAARPQVVRLVGKHCESSDLIATAQVPSGIRVGDLLATPVTGAYGYSMGVLYHRIGRPAVVFVRDGLARVVIWRETTNHLLGLDAAEPFRPVE